MSEAHEKALQAATRYFLHEANTLTESDERSMEISIRRYLTALLSDDGTVEEVARAIHDYAESLPETSKTRIILRSQRIGVAQAAIAAILRRAGVIGTKTERSEP